MDEKEVNFSLSYEQLTRIAEERIRECNLDSQGAIYISESAKAGAVLSYWYELAINGYASVIELLLNHYFLISFFFLIIPELLVNKLV